MTNRQWWIMFALYIVVPGLVTYALAWVTDLGFHNELPGILQTVFDWLLHSVLTPIIAVICIPFVFVQVSKNNP